MVVLAIDFRAAVNPARKPSRKPIFAALRRLRQHDDRALIDRPPSACGHAFVSRGVDLLSARPDVDPARIYGFGKERAPCRCS